MTSWIEFANKEKTKLNCQDKFKIISHLWKNKKADIVTLNVNYVMELHEKISMLNNELLDYKNKYQKLLELCVFLDNEYMSRENDF